MNSSNLNRIEFTSDSLLTLDSLPPEVQLDLLSFLNPIELIKTCRTCKKLRRVGLSDRSNNNNNNNNNLNPSESLSVRTPNGLASFEDAYSHYEIYLFIRFYSNLLGFWQGDMPNYGKLIRISFLPKSNSNPNGPSFLCQSVSLKNKLIELNWKEWKEFNSFDLGRSIVSGIGGGTQLEKWNELLKVDLCYPKMMFEELWKIDWKDFLLDLRNDSNKNSDAEAEILWNNNDDDNNSDQGNHSSSCKNSFKKIVKLKVERIDLYEGVEKEYEDFKFPTEHGSLPNRFPTPSSLPAFSTVECEVPSTSNQNQSLMNKTTTTNSATSSIDKEVTPYNYTPQAYNSGIKIKINRLTMNPDPPPYFQSEKERDFHIAYLNKPLSFFPLKNLPRKGFREMPIWNQEIEEFIHKPPKPELDPSHIDFDWNKLEGLYGVSYGPHGIELIYIKTRILSEEDFPQIQDSSDSDDYRTRTSRPNFWPEPTLQESDMYSSMSISISSIQPGVRILEGIKISGDPHVPRGSISFRAFLDDPSSVSIPWRPPNSSKFKNHLPFPHRTDEKTSNSSLLSQTNSNDLNLAPGYLSPCHGRIAEFGFVEKTWFPAQIHISSSDELRLWWHNMGAVAVAHRLIV